MEAKTDARPAASQKAGCEGKDAIAKVKEDFRPLAYLASRLSVRLEDHAKVPRNNKARAHDRSRRTTFLVYTPSRPEKLPPSTQTLM